jgi:hypothetical protein
MVVKLGVNLLEARIPSANPIIESSSGILYPLLFLFLKPHLEFFHPKHRMVLLSNIAHFIFKSSSDPSEEYLHLLEYYYQAFKYPSTLNLPTLKLSTEDNKCFASQSINAA